MASDAKVVVMSARPSSAEVSLAFSGLTDLFSEVGPPCMEALPPVQRHALDVALLRHEAVPAVDARTVSTAVLSALRHLASASPLLIAIDDVQWLDGASAGCLRFALRRLEASPVTLLVTLSAGANATATVLGAVARDKQVVIDLGPLDEPSTKELLKRGYAGRLPPREVVQVALASGGNPLYAIEIAREVLRVGHGHGALPLPSGLRELMNARFARLPARTREALVELACLASGRAGIIDPVPLARAEAAGLIATEGDGRLRFTHPLLAVCIYDTVPLTHRRAVHRRLSDRVDDPEERARHLALASDGAKSPRHISTRVVTWGCGGH
jgi:predicted ATPase